MCFVQVPEVVFHFSNLKSITDIPGVRLYNQVGHKISPPAFAFLFLIMLVSESSKIYSGNLYVLKYVVSK